MADTAGFRVDGALYPFPDSFTIGDSVLVKMVGGLDMEDFGELLAEGNATSDPRALVGMIAVAVWRKNPRWDLQRVTRFVHQIDMEKLGFEGSDEPAGEVESDDEADPPSPKPTEPESPDKTSDSEPLTGTPSAGPAGESGNGPSSGSDVTPLSRSGSPVSPITSVASGPGN